jgi:hypothetical protein
LPGDGEAGPQADALAFEQQALADATTLLSLMNTSSSGWATNQLPRPVSWSASPFITWLRLPCCCRAEKWARNEIMVRDRNKRSLLLSSARSALFNQVTCCRCGQNAARQNSSARQHRVSAPAGLPPPADR